MNNESSGEFAHVLARLRAVAGSRPDATALVADDVEVSYGELVEMVERCASGLQACGCGRGDAIAVVVPNSLDFVIAALATFALGGVLMPLNVRFKPDELRQYIDSGAPRAILCAPELAGTILPLTLPSVAVFTSTTEIAAAAEGRPFKAPSAIDPDAPALYMFSSGSTGKSKRVTRTQRNLLAEYDALAATVDLSGEDRILCTVPLFHAHGFANVLFAALMSGGCMVMSSAEFNARATMTKLVEHGISIYPAVPFMFKMLCETRFSPAPDLGRLRLLLSAGAPLPESVNRRFQELYGRAISQLYGSTETGAIAVNVGLAMDKPASVGRPLAGFEVEVRDEDGRRLPSPMTGEVWVRTPAATQRYDGLPEMSAQCFAGDFFFPGDTGYIDADGDLYITGRKKLMINVAGYKVDPIEVQDVLAQHPKVADVVVFGVRHVGYGEKIKAVVVVKEDARPCEERELLSYAAMRLADYKMPKIVEFRDEVPRNQLGKVLMKYL